MVVSMFSKERMRKADRGGMISAYERWPALARQGFGVSYDLRSNFDRAFFMGMGGSAAAGDILAGWASGREGAEIAVLKGSVPASGMKGAIALAVSVSGKTEETVKMLMRAVDLGAQPFVISGDGAVKDTAKKLGAPHVQVPPALAQRLMLPFLVYSSLRVLDGALSLKCGAEVEESFASLDAELKEGAPGSPEPVNGAKVLAATLAKRTPAVYADRVAYGVGVRCKNVINENSKKHAHFDAVPEAFHNEIESWEDPEKEFIPVFLRHSFEDPSDSEKLDLMVKLLEGLGKEPVTVRGRGQSRLSQLMSLTYRLDLTSYYLAVALGRDPLPTELLQKLKRSGDPT